MGSGSRAIRVAAVAAGVALLAGACGGSSPKSTTSSSTSHHAKSELVYFIFNGYTPPYFAPMAQGITAVAKHYPNLDIKTLSADSSASTEISQIHEAVAAGAKGIVLNPVDESVTIAAQQAMSSGVPVVTLDRDISNPAGRIAFIGDNDTELGQQEARTCLAELASKHLPKPWNVVDIQGTPGASTSVNREAGIESVLKPLESSGQVKVVLNQEANFDTGTAQSLISEFLAKTHNIQLILASNDAMALGAITALQSAGIKAGEQTYVCGADAQPQSLTDVKNGTQLVTVTHSPYLEAFWAVEALSNYLTTKTKPSPSTFPGGVIHIPQIIVTKANVATIAGWGTPATIPALPYGKSTSYPST